MTAPVVRVWSTGSTCVRCRATLRELARLGVPHQVLDLGERPADRDRYVAAGHATAPVVEVEQPDGTVSVWSGHRPDRVAALQGAAPVPRLSVKLADGRSGPFVIVVSADAATLRRAAAALRAAGTSPLTASARTLGVPGDPTSIIAALEEIAPVERIAT